MTEWVAISYGALDVTKSENFDETAEIILLSTIPSVPIGLSGVPGSFWRRLAENGPISDNELTCEEQILIREFACSGIASDDLSHAARSTKIESAWLSSPFHELVYALIASLARDNSIEVVFIKGPMLHRQGLRKREHSGDVDVWVDPTKIDSFSKTLLPWGWISKSDLWGNYEFYHSITLGPEEWGCEIDIHRHMPGCALTDLESFAVLRDASISVDFGGVSAQVPTVAANAVLSALHSLRPNSPASLRSRAQNASDVLQGAGAEALEFSNKIRASAALAATLQHAFPGAEFDSGYDVPHNWKWRAASSPLGRTLMILRTIPITKWPEFLRELLWPKSEVAIRMDLARGRGSTNALTARIVRIKSAVMASLPRRR